MKFFFYILTSLLFSYALVGCQNVPQDTADYMDLFSLDDFNQLDLSCEPLTLNVSRPVLIKVIPDKNLLIVLEKDGENLGKVFTLDSLHHIKSFISVGTNAGSQLIAFGIQYIEKEKEVLIADPIKRQLFAYDIDSLTETTRGPVMPSRSIDFDNLEIVRPLILATGKIVDLYPSSTVDSINILQFFSKIGQFEKSFGKYPAHRIKYAPYELFSVFMSGINLSNDRKNILLNYHYSDYLDIYDIEGKIRRRLRGPYDNDPVFERVEVRGGKAVIPGRKSLRSYIGDAHMGEKLLALYGGDSANKSVSHGTQLLQFDQAFCPEIAYSLEVPIFTFDIDWSNGVIYGLTDKLGNYRLVKYRLQ